jgi:hypothetical protein
MVNMVKNIIYQLDRGLLFFQMGISKQCQEFVDFYRGCPQTSGGPTIHSLTNDESSGLHYTFCELLLKVILSRSVNENMIIIPSNLRI